jgi:hypothetical protein
MYIPDIQKEIEREYEIELDPNDVNDAFTESHEEVFSKTDIQGAYHLWENGFEMGEADESDLEADAVKLGVKPDDVLDRLDSVFQQIYREKLESLCAGREEYVVLNCTAHGMPVWLHGGRCRQPWC